MKKVINTLCLLAVLALILIIILDFWIKGHDQRGMFIKNFVKYILIVGCIPIFLGMFSLAYNKDKLPPKYWLLIYAAILLFFTVAAVKLGGLNAVRDLPNAISRTYETISGSPITEGIDRSTQTIKMGEIAFTIDREVFDVVINEQQYTIIYLENSKYVIDLLDFDGKSLLKQGNGG